MPTICYATAVVLTKIFIGIKSFFIFSDVVIGIKVDTMYGRARIEDTSDNVRNFTEKLSRNNDKCEHLNIKIKVSTDIT